MNLFSVWATQTLRIINKTMKDVPCDGRKASQKNFYLRNAREHILIDTVTTNYKPPSALQLF